MNTQRYNIFGLQKHFPDAFGELPECYQADNCLVFEQTDEALIAYPKNDQEWALGHWEAYWDSEGQVWRHSDDDLPIYVSAANDDGVAR